MKHISLIILCFLTIQGYAQKTITDKWHNGKLAKQYTVNSNGDRHGTYKTWNRQGRLTHESNWVNGVEHGRNVDYDDRTGAVQRYAIMHNGQITSLKTYSYNDAGTKRTLNTEGTWRKNGTPLTYRTLDYDGSWYEKAGKLSNGYWHDSWRLYRDANGSYVDGNYAEIYNGNDTVYIWSNRGKEFFEGKFIAGNFILSEERTKQYMKEHREHLRQDSIQRIKHEEQRLAEEKRREQDSIKYALREQRAKFVKDSIASFEKAVNETYRKYVTLIIEQYNRKEGELYNKLVKYLYKKRDVDTKLQDLILSMIGITYNDLEKYKVSTGWSNSITDSEYCIWVQTKSRRNPVTIKAICSCVCTKYGRNCRHEELLVMHEYRLALIEIINYVAEHNIKL